MKKAFFLFTLACCTLLVRAGGHSEYGLKLGLSFGAPLGPLVEGSKGKPGLYPAASAYYEYKFTPKWGLLAEINYHGMNAGFETPYADFFGDGTLIRTDPKTGVQTTEPIKDFYIYYAYVKGGRMKNGYLSVPISAVYHLRRGWRLNFGSHINFRLKGEMTGLATDVYLGTQGQGGVVSAYDFNESDEFAKITAGLNAGVQYQLKMGLNFDVRFTNDLTSYFKQTFDAAPGTYRLMTVQTTVGYRIGGGKELK
ncbi:MAG: PorT family protein [Chitinophagales bacterium]|nr:PorT family protein [Chitinophagales bacterium]